jgi:predicted tellurium resistance membrane protein TerC
MPRRLLRVFLLTLAGLGFFALFRPVFAQQPPAGVPAAGDDPSKYPNVVVEPAGGGAAQKGKLRLSAVAVKTSVGSTTIDMEHVRRITIQPDAGGKANDTVLLTDKSVVHGRVLNEQFVLETSVGVTTVKKADVREIEVARQVSLSWTAILFGLLTLTAMEIILGIDNVIFLAIVVGRLPQVRQPQASKLGLGAALGTRILLLFSLSFLLTLTAPLFTLPALPFFEDIDAREVSWRDLILLGGGLFLIGKSVVEVHKKLEEAKTEHAAAHDAAPARPPGKPASFAWTIVTIAIIDIVFSLDSVITAIGMVEQVWVMVIAMVIAMAVMLYFAGPIGHFVEKHPTLKILALSFLILIGVMLVAEGLGQHMDKGYIYVAMAFAVIVEMVNMQLRKPRKKKEPPSPAAVTK